MLLEFTSKLRTHFQLKMHQNVYAKSNQPINYNSKYVTWLEKELFETGLKNTELKKDIGTLKKELSEEENEFAEFEDKIKALNGSSLSSLRRVLGCKLEILRKLAFLELEQLQEIELLYGPRKEGFEESLD